MLSRINLFILIWIVSLVSVAVGQETAGLPSPAGGVASDANQTPVLSLPYIAEITDENVYVRSGPGTNYYACGKFKKGDTVKVVDHKFSWSRIVPLPGSFSWISKQYVKIEPTSPSVGIVTGEAVRVYAGAADRDPMRSGRLQGKLNTGEKVELMGEEKDDYYKIAPPAFAYLWVSTKYTKPLRSVEPVSPPSSTPDAELEPNDAPPVPPAVIPAKVSVEAEKLQEYYALEKSVKAERAKPISQQNYSDIKEALAKISDNKEAGKAARYAAFTIQQIKRFELAFEVGKAVKLQEQRLEEVLGKIEKARAARLAEVQDLGIFAAIGMLQTSEIYGSKSQQPHYRIIDKFGTITCYALPDNAASKMALSKLVGKKVGLVGTIEPHMQTKGALVRFTEVTQLD